MKILQLKRQFFRQTYRILLEMMKLGKKNSSNDRIGKRIKSEKKKVGFFVLTSIRLDLIIFQ